MEYHQHLLEDPDLLLRQYLASQKEIEEANQVVYDYKRQLQTAEALNREYESEIESINAESKVQLQLVESKLLHIEEEFAIVKESLDERAQTLENELLQRDRENEELRMDLEVAKKIVCVTEASNDGKLVDELVELREEKKRLLEVVDELRESAANFEGLNNIQVDKLKQLKSECEELHEALSLKKYEVDEANELIQTLQDEIMCLKAELETLKSRPLEEQSKGNSLFAEVDDRRVQLQSTVNLMRTKYHEMKRERADHLKLIAHLRNENTVLCRRWETEVIQKANDDAMVNDSFQRRIQCLEDLVEKYKKDLNEKMLQFSGSSCDEMKFFDNMLKIKKKEIDELCEKIAALSLSQTLLTKELAETRRDVRKWKLEATQYKNEANNLKSELQEIRSEHKKVCREFEVSGIDLLEENRRSNITTRKKNSVDAQLFLKSCLKTKSDDPSTGDKDFLEPCSKEPPFASVNEIPPDESKVATVDALLQFDLSPSYLKENNHVPENKSQKVGDASEYEPKKVHFTEDTADNVKTSKIKSFKISTSCSVTYVDNQGDKVANKENIEQPL